MIGHDTATLIILTRGAKVEISKQSTFNFHSFKDLKQLHIMGGILGYVVKMNPEIRHAVIFLICD